MNRARMWIVTAAAAAGAMIGAAGIAAAVTNSQAAPTPTSTSSSGEQQGAPGGADPATVAHGPGETLLTGTTAEKVRAAALAAVPGGTVIRVETDSEGSPYEAHMRKSDGTEVTVKVDTNFKVTATEDGFGRGGHH